MPERRKKSFFSLSFFSGLLTSCLISVLFLREFRGSVPEVLPCLLLFFLSYFVGGICGSAEIFRKNFPLCVLPAAVPAFALPFLYGFPDLFAMVSGFSGGGASAVAFSSLPEDEDRCFSFREFFHGVIAGTVLSVLDRWLPAIPAAAAVFLCGQRLASSNLKKVCSKVLFAVFFLLLIAGSFFFPGVPGKLPSAGEGNVSPPAGLKRDLICAYAGPETERILLVLPERSGFAGKNDMFPWECTTLRYGGAVGSLLLRERLLNDDSLYDIAAVELPPRGYFTANRAFVNVLRRKLRPGGVLIFLPVEKDMAVSSAAVASLWPGCFLSCAGGVPLIAASDHPIEPRFGRNSRTDALKAVLYPSGWEEKVRVFAAENGIPDRYYTLERHLLKQKQSPYFLRLFNRIFSLSLRSALLTSVLGICVYFLLRYVLAYTSGAGLFLSVFGGSFLVFSALGGVFLCRVLSSVPSGILFGIVLIVFAAGAVAGSVLPESVCRWRYAVLLPVCFATFLLIQSDGLTDALASAGLSFLTGCIFALILKREAKRFGMRGFRPVQAFSGASAGVLAVTVLFSLFSGI